MQRQRGANTEKGFISEEEYFKLSPCRKKRSVELFCHKSIDTVELMTVGNNINDVDERRFGIMTN